MTPDTRKQTSKKDAKREARRAQLMAIAAECFAARGFAQTTVRDIADKAGLFSGSLYHYFASKDVLLSEIIIDLQKSMITQFEEIVEREASARDALSGLVKESFRYIHEHPHQVALYQNEGVMLAHLPEFDAVNKNSRHLKDIWLNVLTAGVTAGDFRSDLDCHVVYLFIRSSVWSTVRWYQSDGRLTSDALAEQFLHLLDSGWLAA